MNHSIKLLIFSLIISFAGACTNTQTQAEKTVKADIQAEKPKQEEVKEEETLHLNNGEKWTVNKATEIGMINIQRSLILFTKNKSTDYAVLGETLSKETETIINKCDMTGPDHDQLHVILHPMLTSIRALKEGNAGDVEKLNGYMGEYFKHFQAAKGK